MTVTYLEMIDAANEILYKSRIIIHSIRVHIRQLRNSSQVEIGIDIEGNRISTRRCDAHRNTTIHDQISTSSSSFHLYRVPRA